MDMKKSKKLIDVRKLKLKELKIEEQEKANKKKEEEKEKEEEQEKETKLETENLELITESRSAPVRHEVSTFQDVEFFEPEISTKEFAAPVLTSIEESKEALEVTAQNTPTSKTNISTPDNTDYTAQRDISYSSYSPNTGYAASTRSYEPRKGRREEERERFDIREGLIADASKIVLTAPTSQAARGWDRVMPQMAELEEFAEEQKKYKEKIEGETIRRRRMR